MPLSDHLNMFFNNWKMRNYKFLSVQRIKETTMIECIFHNKTFKNAPTDKIILSRIQEAVSKYRTVF
jgi:hypothetical protein